MSYNRLSSYTIKIAETKNVKKSEIDIATQAPLVPKNEGIVYNSGSKIITCLKSDINIDLPAFPMDRKKVDTVIGNPMNIEPIKQNLNPSTHSFINSGSLVNARESSSGQSSARRMKGMVHNVATRVVRNKVSLTLLKFLAP